MDTIGRRIKRLRDEKGMSMDAFGKAIGTDSANVSNWERDRRVPGGKFLIEMSDYCGVSTDWILKGEGRENVTGGGYDISLEEHDLIIKLRELDEYNRTEITKIIEMKHEYFVAASKKEKGRKSSNSLLGTNDETCAGISDAG